MGFQLVPNSVTLNGIRALILRVAIRADYVKVVEDRPILSATRTTCGNRSFAVSGPTTWNSLPVALQSSDAVE